MADNTFPICMTTCQRTERDQPTIACASEAGPQDLNGLEPKTC